MMRSMFSGVSGLRIHQTKMDVIANNVANVNTVGFKTSRATFSDVFSQTVSGASQANAESGLGGVNPMQIGLGANVATIDKLMTPGAAQRTDNPMDLMIQGDGFFIVGDASGTYFTRAGALDLDKGGNLVNAAGQKVMGWDTKLDPKTQVHVPQRSTVKPIVIGGDKAYVAPTATSVINFEGNLNPMNDNGRRESTMDFFDTVGNRYVVDTVYEYTPTTNTWSFKVGNAIYPEGDRTKGIAITPSASTITVNGGAPNPAQNPIEVANFSFDTNGLMTASIPDLGGEDKFSFDLSIPDPAGGLLTPDATFGANNAIRVNLGSLTQFANETSSAQSIRKNGNSPGSLTGMNVGSDGIITGRYSNGDTRILAQIPVALFKNAAGLESVGNNLFVATTNSGDFDEVGSEVGAGGGMIQGGALEMSNVDLAQEFTEMITTQRGFQANSRTITTSDEMLQELVNLKR